jgi:hypothetical protein
MEPPAVEARMEAAAEAAMEAAAEAAPVANPRWKAVAIIWIAIVIAGR